MKRSLLKTDHAQVSTFNSWVTFSSLSICCQNNSISTWEMGQVGLCYFLKKMVQRTWDSGKASCLIFTHTHLSIEGRETFPGLPWDGHSKDPSVLPGSLRKVPPGSYYTMPGVCDLGNCPPCTGSLFSWAHSTGGFCFRLRGSQDFHLHHLRWRGHTQLHGRQAGPPSLLGVWSTLNVAPATLSDWTEKVTGSWLGHSKEYLPLGPGFRHHTKCLLCSSNGLLFP